MDLPNSLTITKQKKELILSVIQTTIWCNWKARNESRFRHYRILKEKIVDDVKILSYFWVKHRKRRNGLDWTSWMSFDVG
ncbi:hypothetical protein R6Q59_024717 [Mikania micrantha]